MATTASYTREQVAQHNEKSNGWLIINNAVYDVSRFYDDHPGGRDVLLAKIGGDATDDFEAVHHSSGAMRKLHDLCVGSLDRSDCRTFVSLEQVRQKASPEAAWFVINNKVYDISTFLDDHPGGRDVLLCYAGTDATKAFVDNGHSDMAYTMMRKYCIGDVEPAERKPFVERSSHGQHAKSAESKQTATQRKGDTDASLAQRVFAQLKIAAYIAVFCIIAVYVLS